MKGKNLNKKIILTFDYELFLKESGSLDHCLIKPTERLRGVLNKHNIKATFFIDILYYNRLLQSPEHKNDTLKFKEQIQELLKDGHNIELHLHPHWLDAKYLNNQWIFPEIKTYRLQQLNEEVVFNLFKLGINLLETICKPIDENYTVTAFRAGGLCITPFDKIKNSFNQFNIIIDSSIAKGLKSKSENQNYNFENAPDDDYFRFEENPLIKEINGKYIEIPITVYNINIFDKIKSKFKTKRNLLNKPFSYGEGKSLRPINITKSNILKNIFSKLSTYKMPYSVDFIDTEIIINKLSKSKKKIFTFLSHNKFLSSISLEIIEILAKENHNFINLKQYYENDILNNKTLILITGYFPFLVDEGYLKDEIVLLGKKFKNIIIITQDTFSTEHHALPDNCKVYRIKSTLKRREFIYFSFLALFNFDFYKEIYEIFNTYRRLPNKKILIDLLTFINSGKKILRSINKILKVENTISKNTIVYTYWLDKCSYTASKLLKSNKVKVAISRAHSFDIYLWRNENNYLPFRKYLYKNLSYVYFISEHGKNYFENILKINSTESSNLRISRLGVNNNFVFNEDQRPKNENNCLSIVSCSWINPIKRIEKIIEGLSLVENIQVSWTHIGSVWEIIDYAESVYKLAENKLSNKSNIKYEFIGKIEYNDLLNYYSNNKADVFINLSFTEGLPVSIMEAMSFGIPVIATSVGGTPEIVNDSNGILISPDPTPQEIANAIIRMNNFSDEEYLKYRKNAYQTWKENFNAEKNYKNFVEEIYNYSI